MDAVLISGASGLVGTALRESLARHSIHVLRLVRNLSGAKDEVTWAGDELTLPQDQPLAAVVHLAGEPIMGLWTASKKRAIAESRIQGTQRLCRYMAARTRKPAVMVCASAIGFYGSRGDELLTEDSPSGAGFLAETCRAWEAATEPARAAGIRVVNLRIGVVLSKRGGALASMLTPFKLGLGSRLGSGRQWTSWLALADLTRAIEFCIQDPAVSGPVNATAPNPVTNAEFTRVLAATLHRPTFLPLPAFALKLAPGGFAQETLLASQRVLPKKLQDSGFQFEQPTLNAALSSELES